MSKIFEYRGDQMIDQVTGSALTNSGVEIKRTEKGMAGSFDGVSDYITATNFDIGTNPTTFVFFAKNIGSGLRCLIGSRLGGSGFSITLDNSANTFWYWNYAVGRGVSASVPASKIDKEYHMFTFIRGGITGNKLYIDDIDLTLGSNNENLEDVSQGIPPSIGRDPLSGRYFEGNIQNIHVFDGLISYEEIIKLYQGFLHTFPQAETKYQAPAQKPTSLNEDGLVAAYNMVPSPGGVLSDVSNNGNNGTINGAISTLEGMSFDGVDDYVSTSFSETLSTWSISCRFKPKTISSNSYIVDARESTSNRMLFLFTGSQLEVGHYLSAKYTDLYDINEGEYYNITIIYDGTNIINYLNGIASTPIPVSIASFTPTSLFFGANTSGINNSNIECVDSRIFNKAISEQEAKDYHNQFANQVYYRNTFKHEPTA